jgi:hypothetical protein
VRYSPGLARLNYSVTKFRLPKADNPGGAAVP